MDGRVASEHLPQVGGREDPEVSSREGSHANFEREHSVDNRYVNMGLILYSPRLKQVTSYIFVCIESYKFVNFSTLCPEQGEAM